MDVKLNGVRAKMNPSRGRYSTLLIWVRAALRLDAVDLGGKCGIVAQEIDGLAGRVDLRLIEVLALAEHAGSIDDSAVLACEQVCNFQYNRGPDCPVELSPFLMRIQGCLYGHFNLLRTRLVVCCQYMAMVMRHDHLSGVACTDLLAADNQRYVELDTALSFKFGFEGYSLRRAFQIGFYRFIGRYREIENCILHT